MGDPRGFKQYDREKVPTVAPDERVKNFEEFYKPTDDDFAARQSARCMDCGVPFCHSGCPLGNRIPEFNHAVYQQDWKEAFEILMSTNNFPEFTGRICPAPCEGSCVLGINSDPVNIEYLEKTIIEQAYDEGWVSPLSTVKETGKKVAIVGSGPAGLAASEQLRKAGHQVTVYEKNTRIGGLMRYGIPDYKLGKQVIDRRLEMMKQSGIEFLTGVNVGQDITGQEMMETYDAVVLAGGSSVPRDLQIPGRDLKGVSLAMPYLEQNNKRVAGDLIPNTYEIEGKKIVVIGGGDTGSDCIGTSHRLGAESVVQLEILGKPPVDRTESNPWPQWPMTLKTSSSHEEGADRQWAVMTKAFLSDDGVNLSGIEVVEVQWATDESGKRSLTEREGSSRIIPCDYAFLAMGFLHPQKAGLLEELNVMLDPRGNVDASNYKTSVGNVFVAGDMRRGQSLVVWAISEGRECARAVDSYLIGQPSLLPSKTGSVLEV